ncbi:MAG: VCBS repeat-containing protein, partial [Opitutales bacterium]
MNSRIFRAAALLGSSVLIAEAKPLGFQFGDPEVIKLDWNAKCMMAKDLNGDGKIDLAVINPERARIDILYRRKPGEKVSRVRSTTPDRWEPDLEDAPYLRETVPFDGDFANLALEDLDLDGRPDLIYGGPGEGVSVRFREKDDSWSKPLELDANDPLPGTRSLAVRDLDGDGHAELIIFSEEGLERISFDGRKPKTGIKKEKLSSAKARGFRFADYDGDGSDDLLYIVPGSERALRTLRWSGSGFLAETSHPLASHALSSSNSAPVAVGELSFASIDGDSSELLTFQFRKPVAKKGEKNLWKPRIRNLFPEKAGSFLHALADFDGDGHLDLTAVAPKEAQLRFLRGRKDGGFEASVSFPFLRGVSALAAGDFDGDGKASLLVSSEEEGMVGVCRLQNGKRFGFPEPLAIEDDTVAMACSDLDGDGRAEAL